MSKEERKAAKKASESIEAEAVEEDEGPETVAESEDGEFEDEEPEIDTESEDEEGKEEE